MKMSIKKKVTIFLNYTCIFLAFSCCYYKDNKEIQYAKAQDGLRSQTSTINLITLFNSEDNHKRNAPIQNPYEERIHAFIEGGHLLQITTPDEAQQQLGKPRKKHETIVKNKHEKTADKWITYIYDGIVLVFYHVTNYNRFFLFDIEITSSKHNVMYTLNVGKTKEEIIKELGDFGRSVDTALEYYELGEDYLPGLVRFYFNKEKISKINWIYPLD
jgi:hypothetical protein